MEDARAVANFFLEKAWSEEQAISAMKIQKLVYFAHGWHLAAFNTALLNEAIEAWKYGPVVPTLYQEFKKFGSGPITSKATIFTSDYRFITPEVCNEVALTIMGSVWESYGGLSAIQLSNLTHEPASPWSVTYRANEGRRGIDIPDDLIRQYFAKP